MTQLIPPKALALLAEDVRLLEVGTAEEERDLTVYRDNPVGFIREVLRESPWSKQVDIANAVRDNYRVALRTCNSAGKTFLPMTPQSSGREMSRRPSILTVRLSTWKSRAFPVPHRRPADA